MILDLLIHRWKDYMRTQGYGNHIAMQILGFIGLLLFMAMALGMGIGLMAMMGELYAEDELIYKFCGYLLYYYAGDIFLRFLAQDIPSHAIQPYLLQTIKRRTLANFMCVNSLAATGLVLLPLVLLPFIIIGIGSDYGVLTAIAFIITIYSFSLVVHFGVLFIKRKTFINPIWLAGFVLVIAGLAGADYMKWISVREVSSMVFIQFVKHAWLCVLAMALAFAAFYNYHRLLTRDMYFDQDAKKQVRVSTSENYKFFDQFGQVGEMLALEVKMILRNKRPRYLLLSYLPLLIFYTYSDYATGVGDHPGGVLFKAALLTSLPIFIFGQYIFAWQSVHFDGTMTSRISLPVYIKGKLIVLYTIIFIITLILSGFGIVDWRIIPLQIAASLFNAGITSLVLVFIATYHFAAVDLDSVKRNNQQEGILMRIVMMLALVASAAFLYLPFHWLGHDWWGIAALGIAGALNLLFINKWIGVMADEFNMRRYQILEGFRK